jgi:arylsulfatase A-like enzyme
MSITRRGFLGSSSAAFLKAQSRVERPNIIVILTDDHGAHDLGCQGATDLKTPNIDAIAASGIRFTNWYSNAPMCAPARAALLTGMYPQNAGVPDNGGRLPYDSQTLATLLKNAGYKTGLTGKWHLGDRTGSAPNALGFDSFFGFHAGCVDFYSHRYYWGEPRRINFHDLWKNRTEIFEDGQYLTERITAEAQEFIQSSRSQPFFLYAAYNAPHYPMHAPRKYVERFPGLEPERQMYAAMISAVDDGVGEIRSLLSRLGIAENTIIFFGSDNGATREPRAGLNQQTATAGRNTPYRGYKFSLFDGGMHVPGLLSWPSMIRRPRVSAQIGSHMDLVPTMLSAAGASVPGGLDGVNLLDAIREPRIVDRPPLFWSSWGQLAVRRGDWKLVKNGVLAETGAHRRPLVGDDALFLSNLESDPGESKNLRRRHPDLAQELEAAAEAWLKTIPAPAPK